MWTSFERRWRDALLDKALPTPSPPRPAPEDWARWAEASPWLLRVGFRAAVWWLTLSSLLRHGRPLRRLGPAQADRLLARAATRRDPVRRQLVTVVKVVVGLASALPRSDRGEASP